MKRAIIPALLIGAGITLAPTAQARPSQADCGAMGKGEVYIMSGIGGSLNCERALAVAGNAMDGKNIPGWTCEMDRFTGWCTQPPDQRIELH